MGHRRFKYKKDDLPEILPIFPLSQALLLPGGDLPLNIFEPRYMQMVKDSLATDRLIGIIQPVSDQSQSQEPRKIYDIGCAGQISSFTEKADGNLMITLTGICRFKVQREIPQDYPYRRVHASWDDFCGIDLVPSDCCIKETRPQLIELLIPYLEQNDMVVDKDKIDDVPDDRLMTCLSMLCPFDKAEQQALLEANNQKERCRLMLTMIEFSLKNLDNNNQQQ